MTTLQPEEATMTTLTFTNHLPPSDPKHVYESVTVRRDGRCQFIGRGGAGSEYGGLEGAWRRPFAQPQNASAGGICTFWMTPDELEAWRRERGVEQ